MAAELIIDGATMAALLRSPAGPVGRHLLERATVVQTRARQLAPVKTGCLRDSIVKRFETNGVELQIRIQSDTTPCSPSRTSYSLMVHEGTRPHEIRPKNPDGVLAFKVGGETIFARVVQHPGTKPIPFLRDALPLAVI